jgi:methoxymalonate biosynthesis acyl carrier protein
MDKIISILNEIRPEIDFQTSENFIKDGLLDSYDVITLVSELDKMFLISIDGADIIPENFKNLQSIKSLLIKNGIKL